MSVSVLAWIAGGGVTLGIIASRDAARLARRHTATVRLTARLAGNSVVDARRLRELWRDPPRWLEVQMLDLDVPVPLAQLWRWWRVAIVVGPITGVLLGTPVLAMIIVGVVASAPIVAAALVRSRQAAAYDATLASALDAIARGVRSGGSLANAIGESAPSVRGPIAADIERVAASARRGLPLPQALSEWSDRRDRPSVRLAVAALVLAAETGGPPARVIEEVAGALRVQRQVEGEARALAAQARLSAVVVGLAPIAFLVLTSLTGASNLHMLFGTPIGVACLVVGLSLDAIGAVWMHRISESVSR